MILNSLLRNYFTDMIIFRPELNTSKLEDTWYILLRSQSSDSQSNKHSGSKT